MAKKKRSPNPNLKFSQASRDEGNKNIKGPIVEDGDSEEATRSSLRSPSMAVNQGGDNPCPTDLEISGEADALIGQNQSRHLSKTRKGDSAAGEAISGNWATNSGDPPPANAPIEDDEGPPAQLMGTPTKAPPKQPRQNRKTLRNQSGTGEMNSGTLSKNSGATPTVTNPIEGDESSAPVQGAPAPISAQTDSGNDPNSTLDLGIDLRKTINSKGIKLKYFPPMVKHGVITAQLHPPELEAELDKWKDALIFYVIGSKPSFNAIRKFVCHLWKKIAEPRVFLHNDGYFILRFNCNVIDEILSMGPYMFNGKPVVVKQWCQGFDFHAENNRCVPVWVRFPSLPLPWWSENSLSRIGSALGIPICSDKYTAQQLRISFARMLIEIDVTRSLESSIMVNDGQGNDFEQQIIYEWVPHYCSKCCQVGHSCEFKTTGGKKKKSKNSKKKIWVKKTLEGKEEKKEKERDTSEIEEVKGDAPGSSLTPLVDDGAADTSHTLQQMVCSSSQQPLKQQQLMMKTQQEQQEMVTAAGNAEDPLWPDLPGNTRLQLMNSQNDAKERMKPSDSTTPDASSYLNITMRKTRRCRLPP